MGIGYGTISVRHDIPHILLPFSIPGGKSAGDILVYAILVQAVERPTRRVTGSSPVYGYSIHVIEQ